MEKLPLEFKQKWVAALRSGEYKQGDHILFWNHNNTYCCMGVACKVVNISTDRLNYSFIPNTLETFENIPLILKGANDITCKLARMNDKQGKSFEEIADWIEINL